MSTALQIAQELAGGAERARVAGDIAASIDLAMAAAQYLQLARAFERPVSANISTGQQGEPSRIA